MEHRDHLVEIRCPSMVYDRHAAEVEVIFARRGANGLLIAEQRDLRQTLADAVGRGRDCPWIIAFRKDYVLRSGSGALANSFENVHGQSV
jgi:hypothetical protein